jgi:hypothetical protein
MIMSASVTGQHPLRLHLLLVSVVATLALASPRALPLAVPLPQSDVHWTDLSDENAKLLLDIMTEFSPEIAAEFGVDGVDEDVVSYPLDLEQQQAAATRAALKELRARASREQHPAVRQDLEILVGAAERSLENLRLSLANDLPYENLHEVIYLGVSQLLDDRIAEERRPAALVRLRRYAGLEPGYTALVDQVIARLTVSLENPELAGPFADAFERHLLLGPRFLEGIAELCEKHELEGHRELLDVLQKQLETYTAFLHEHLRPRLRHDFRLPPERYAFLLEQTGVDMPIEELSSRAKVAFREIQNQMQALAPLVAEQHGFHQASDYRDVIRSLKQQQFESGAILPHYEERLEQLEALVVKHAVLTLPERPMRIRLATQAESAAIPAPHMSPPRFLGNTGEVGEFVLPVTIPKADGGDVSFDDFTFDAASWTLSVHEGRPGHELQFASILERGVSITRILFAFNSVNVEGWALYAEAEMQPYLPLDGQLIALQHRLLRAARAWLDPGLQDGSVTREQAGRVLEQDVVLSPAMTQQEVDRYTFWAPGQATAYFCGYSRLMELRTDVERQLARRFDRQAFHDFVLAQGLLSPTLLRKAVMEQFIPEQSR